MMWQDEKPTPPASADARPLTPLVADAECAKTQDPSAKWALALLAEAKPYEEAPGRRQRVWLGLKGSRSRARARWRFAFAALVLSAGAAFAGIGGWNSWLARESHRVQPAPAAQPTAAAPVDRAPPPAAPVDRAPPPAAPVDRAPSPAAPVDRAPPPISEPTAPPAAENPTPRLPKAAPLAAHRRAPKAAAPEDTGPLLQAMRALRVEHNPARARQVLTDYLAEHPRGFLAEEALVMLVEAAVAHHDEDAPALAARYNRLYPNGAFRGQVERTLALYDKRP